MSIRHESRTQVSETTEEIATDVTERLRLDASFVSPNPYAIEGFIGVSINYRLSPRATWPDHIVDVKRAIAWVKTHIADYGGDPDFVAITGGM